MLTKAIEFATKAHAGQKRKGTDIPYIVHPVSVGMALLQAGAPEEAVIAGILHDTLEDTKTTEADLRREFGDTVTDIVKGCTEPDKTLSWEDRKLHTLDHLLTASPEVLMVACADKLSNLRDIAWGLREQGEAVWSRFKTGRVQQEWYYREILNSAAVHCDNSIVRMLRDELAYEVGVVFGSEDEDPA